jgi:predicted  nucleic acid-binding Zn-ribbon protein
MSDFHNLDKRVALLEQIASDTRQALIDIRTDLRELRGEIKTEVRDLRTEMRDLRTEMRDLRTEIWRNFRWLLGIMLGGFVGILATMAHGFHWL